MTIRDSQRSKVYEAERASGIFEPNKAALNRAAGPMTYKEVTALVDKVFASSYTRRKYGERRIDNLRRDTEVVWTHGGANAGPVWGGYELRFGVWTRQPAIVLHEISHLVAGVSQQHGWKFCAVYLDLVRHFMGKEAHDKLKASFKAHRVRFTAPRAKREISEEQRAALVERLAVARAAKAAMVAQ